LGLYDECVFFNDWVSYDERQNYLLQADVGVSLHFAHLETHFSFRTRLLDYIWAGLPTIVTRGDVLSDLVEEHQLGWTVGYESVDDVTEAILQSAAVSRAEFGDRFAAITPQLNWDVALHPLLEFCREPRCAPDRRRARSEWQSLAVLKLVSHVAALRRDVNARDERAAHNANVIAELRQQVAAQGAEIGRLQGTIDQIRQGRVMRLLDRLNRIVKGSSP
jgi:hypothetical protein